MRPSETIAARASSRSGAALAGQVAYRAAALALAALAAALLCVNLGTAPAPWFDEGLNAATARQLALYGRYALPDSEGARPLDPAIQTGPVMLIPMALAFEVLGPGVLQARTVAVGFAALALHAYWLLARRLIGPWPALAAVALLLCGPALAGDPYLFFVPMARQVLGEVAGLGLCCYGFWLWLRAHDERPARPAHLIAAGLAFGMAMVTKSQILVLLPPTLLVALLADRLYYRQASWRAFLVPGAVAVAVVGAWYLAQVLLLGWAQFQANSAVLRAGFFIHIASLDPASIARALGTLWGSGLLLIGAPALLYGLRLGRRRSRAGIAHALPLAFAIIWLAWFVLLSIGWARYGFIGASMLPIWLAGLLAAGWRRVAARQRLGVLLAGAALAIVGAQLPIRMVFGPQDRSGEQFVAYLRERVAPTATVAAWEWNLAVELDHRFDFPATQTTNAVTVAMLRPGNAPAVRYQPATPPDYVIDGPFSSWTGYYADYLATHGIKEIQIGPYALYRIAP